MRTVLIVAASLLTVGAAWAQSPASAPTRPESPAEQGQGVPRQTDIARADHPGRVVFERQCAPCHGAGPGVNGAAMLPGTAALAARYEGTRPAELELRDDLSAAALRLFVRRGIGEMPPFRKAELTDAEIDGMADYIAATSKMNR